MYLLYIICFDYSCSEEIIIIIIMDRLKKAVALLNDAIQNIESTENVTMNPDNAVRWVFQYSNLLLIKYL